MASVRLPARDIAVIAVAWSLVVALGLVMVVGRDAALLPVIDDALSLALAVFAAVNAARAAGDADGPTGRAWATMAAALVVWALGDAVWLFYDVVFSEPTSPSPADVFYLAFNVLLAAGLAQLLATDSHVSRIQLALDGLAVSLSLFLLAWIFSLNRVFDTMRADDNVELTLGLLTPLGDLVVLSIAVLALARSRRHRPAALAIVTAAMAMITVADVILAYLIVEGGYRTGHLIDLLWAVAMALFTVAAVLSRHTPPAPERPDWVPTQSSLWLPYLPLLVVGVFGPPVVMRGVEAALVQLIVCVICGRQILAAWENRQLLTAAADQALRDPLTGLANRTLFRERLDHAMLLRVRDSRVITVISIDLDDFKLVNDSLGHPVADRLLKGAGQRILECVRTGDTVARLGGDEFMLLLEGGADDHQMVARRIVEAFARPFDVDGSEVILRPSLGVASATDDEPDLNAEILVTRADVAMYAAKRSRASEVRTFAADLATTRLDVGDHKRRPWRSSGGGAERIRLLAELRDAVDHGSIEVAYQPKVDLNSGDVIGVEALLRWPHPRLGILRPDAFLSLVRQHGLMRPVSDIVIDRALDDAADWQAAGLNVAVAINLFAPLLRDTRLPDRLCRQLDRRHLDHGALTVEITEDVVLTEISTVKAVLRELRELGIRVAIDDFGSGYSALSYLRDLAIDEVKLDREFIADVTSDDRAAAVASAVINLTHTLGISVVAEGVEDADTAQWLTRHGCHIGQGYHFSAPVEAAQVPDLLRRLGATGRRG